MGVIASDQITLIDLTDGYSVVLTNESHTFLGTTNSVSGTQVTTCMVQALCGSEQIPCSIGTLQLPTGLSIVSDGKVPVPTLTITATSALTKSGTIMIPVKIGDITISKAFSYSIAFRGTDGDDGTSVTVKSTSVTYQKSTSGTTTPTGTWLGSIPTVSAGEFLWTKTEVTYSDNNKTVAYSVSRNGSNGDDGTSVTITNTKIEYQKSSNGTTPPTGSWSTSIPTTAAGEWIWTRTTVTYSDGKSTVSYSVGRNGNNGTNGKDAIILNVISSGGQIFKNTDIATTLTAHVYKGGVELTGSALTSVGTVKWYKDGATTSMATGTTLTIQPGDVLVKASYEAKTGGIDMAVLASDKITLIRVDDGAKGIGVSKTEVQYYLSTSNTTQTGGSWVTTPPNWINGRYYWQKTITTYTDNSTYESKPACITGAAGSTGATGKGVSSIVTEFYLSTDKTTQTGGSWVTSMPIWEPGLYLWIRNKITYTNPSSTEYTTPICDSSWEVANEVNDKLDNSVADIYTEITKQNADITQECNKIILDTLTEYTKSSEFSEYKELTEAQLELLSEQLSLTFSQTISEIDKVSGELNDKYNVIEKYFTFDMNGIGIGQSNSQYKVRVDNDRYSMLVNDVEVLYIADGEVCAPEITVKNKLNMLNYVWELDNKNNLNLTYVGG